MFRNGSDDNASRNNIHSALNDSTFETYRNTTEILNHLVNDVQSLSNHVIFTDHNLDDFFFIINGILVLR